MYNLLNHTVIVRLYDAPNERNFENLDLRTQNLLESAHPEATDQLLLLAERLRAIKGSELDDEAVAAICEATGMPEEYVRMAVTRKPNSEHPNVLQQAKNAALQLDPDVRRYVVSGVLAANLGLLNVLSVSTGDRYGLWGTLAIIAAVVGLWNLTVARNIRAAMTNGALFGGLFFLMRSLFSLILQTRDTIPSAVVIPHVLFGALAGVVLHSVYQRVRKTVGMKDPLEERQELLRQLVDLQDKLRSGEQSMTFLSLDIVGSTKMKEFADSLAVEFTFTEYHKWIEWVATKYGGKVHSTAGDGITCAFPDPRQGISAAKFIQTGIVELNTFRNKIGVPIQLRAGLHHGTVNAPAGEDITKINFSHVIDVAAHMQKVAPIGGIAMSNAVCDYLPSQAAVMGMQEIEVSNVKGRIWAPRAQPKSSDAGPPPLPTVDPG